MIYADESRHLSANELSAISWIVVTMNALNRISIFSRLTVKPEAPPAAATHLERGAERNTR